MTPEKELKNLYYLKSPPIPTNWRRNKSHQNKIIKNSINIYEWLRASIPGWEKLPKSSRVIKYKFKKCEKYLIN